MPTTWTDVAPAYDPEFEEPPDKAAVAPTERLAVVSLVAGIVGFFLPVVGPITAIVSGHVARDEIRKSKGRLGGDGFARTGLLLGYTWIGFTVLTLGACIAITRESREARATPVALRPKHSWLAHPPHESIEGQVESSSILLHPVAPPEPARAKAVTRIVRGGPEGMIVLPPSPPAPPERP